MTRDWSPHVFCGSGMQEQLFWVVLVQNLSWGWCQDMTRAAAIWKPDWVWGIHLQYGTLMAVRRRHQVLATWTSDRAAWVSPWHGSWLPPEWVIEERGRWKLQYLLSPSLGNHKHHFCNIVLILQISPTQCGRGPHKGVNTRGQWSLGLAAILAREEVVLLNIVKVFS